MEEITDTTASLSWRPGPDNHSPVTAHTIQARTPFSLGWQAVTTGEQRPISPGALEGADEEGANSDQDIFKTRAYRVQDQAKIFYMKDD